MTFAKEAWPFVAPFLVAALVAAVAGHERWAIGLAVVGLLVLLFFRNPARHFSGPAGLVLAAADGKVLRVETAEDPAIGPGRWQRIVTFLSVFDVHVQRTPTEGEVLESVLKRGAKVAAFRSDAGEVNESHLTVLKRANGDLIGVRQIAGLLARRVVCYLKPGQRMARGDLLGVIKFGSRVDLMVPASYRVLVRAGDRVRNGETVMAEPPAGP